MALFKSVTRFYKNISIRQKLLLLFCIQIIIPLFFMASILYRKAEVVIQNKSINYTSDILKMIELRLDDFSRNMMTLSQDILYDQVIYNILTNPDVKQDKFVYYSRMEDVVNILRKACLSREELQSIALISDNKEFYSYDSNSGRVIIKESLPYDDMITKARALKGQPLWYLEKDEKGVVQNIYLTRVLYDIADFKEIGLMTLLIKKEFLESVYRDLSTDSMHNIAIISHENEWIVGRDRQSNDMLKQFVAMNLTSDNNYKINTRKNMLISYIQLDNPRWKVVTHISLKKLNKDMVDFRLWLIILMIATLLIMSMFSVLMGVDIINPINRLVKSIKKVQEDKVYEEIAIDRMDELGYLSNCFNKMSLEIDILVNKVYKEQLTRREAELKALQAQINPHFLFNTLESINWMAMLSEAPEISDMVTSLSSLIEGSMGKGNPLISIKEELRYVDSYILIMKNRYGERLVFHKDVDEEVNIQVPRLVLQPIVENAIYHGIDKNRKTGEISLCLKKDNNHVYIAITDNGRGMQQEEVEQLNEKFRRGCDQYLLSKDKRGIGLENVNRRIKLFYGQTYGIKIESDYGKYTKVILTIPRNTLGKGDQ
ncbi:sensor histidine kinase [Vallitalea pronyensis]|uniref:Sensor histidine kinase n=1 Tax=Vallitalea pronyensis TaxID=1348613 RepID=A0A8J8MNL2_9FIRM|nr:histidine kinase [Vallitalea pronyensis]QUI24712.1 sensor histidine kinase [Vallitalea pronyensis]